MPISGTSTDYSARKKDIHIFQGVDPSSSATVTPGFGTISNYCTGIQKLVQRYAICLLTELGSQANFPDFGSSLLNMLVRKGGNMNRLDIYPIFNAANLKIIKTFRNYQRATPGVPNDEQLSTAQLTNVIVAGGTVGLSIRIYPVSGGPVEFVLPIPSN